MLDKLLLLGLAFVALTGPATAQDAAPLEAWEHLLQDEPELVSLVKALELGLEEADVQAIQRQFQAGKLRLQLVKPRQARGLYAHSQARALLADYLRHRHELDLRIILARKDSGTRSVHVALDALIGQGASGRAAGIVLSLSTV